MERVSGIVVTRHISGMYKSVNMNKMISMFAIIFIILLKFSNGRPNSHPTNFKIFHNNGKTLLSGKGKLDAIKKVILSLLTGPVQSSYNMDFCSL